MCSETFKNIAEGIQSIFVVLGLLAAGGWAVWNFKLLYTQQIKQAELKELEKRLEEWGEIQTEVTARQIETVDANEFLIIASVQFKNPGNKYVKLDFTGYPCSIAEVTFNDSGGQPYLQNVGHFSFIGVPNPEEPEVSKMVSNVWVEPNGIHQMSSAFKVSKPGLYFVSCTVKTSAENVYDIAATTNSHPGTGGPFWSGSSFIVVT